MKKKLNLLTIVLALSLLGIISNSVYLSVRVSNMEQNIAEKNTLDSTKQANGVEKLKIDSLLRNLDTIANKLNQIVTVIKPTENFLQSVGHRESGVDYTSVNTLGFIGCYQFGAAALVEAGVCCDIIDAEIFRDKFINTPDSLRTNVWSVLSQDKAMLNYMDYHKRILYKQIAEFNGTSVNGIYITESGILAAAHLGGSGNVKKYLESNGQHNFKDDYGTSIESYFKQFSGYRV